MTSEKPVHHAGKARLERMDLLLEAIKKNPDHSLRQLKALFSLETGLDIYRIDQYLRVLADSGRIQIITNEYGVEFARIVEKPASDT